MIYLKMYWETALVEYDFTEQFKKASPDAKEFWKALARL